MAGDGTEARLYAIYFCDLCVQGKGGECHSPGCALWLNRAPDLALTDNPLCRPIDEHRDTRQAQISSWTAAAFGAEQSTSVPQRGLRLIEEAIEAFQAAGGESGMAHKLIDYVFSRPVGALNQEIGGVSVCVLALAAAAGLSAEAEERREVERVLAKPTAEMATRNAPKNAAGFDATGGDGSSIASAAATCLHRSSDT